MTAPAAPARRRERAGWVALVAAFVVVGVALAFVGVREWTRPPALDPDSPAPDGARAIVRLLAEHGGIPTSSVARLDDALAQAGPDAVLAVGSTGGLSDDDLERLLAHGGDVVLLDPTARDLRLAFGSSGFVGRGTGPVDPGCPLPVAQAADAVSPGAVYDRGDAQEACYPVDDGWGLLRGASQAGATVAAIDAAALLANAHLAEEGAAALGLGLLGTGERVIWYLPRAADAAPAVSPSLGDLTPSWVTPVLVLAALAAAAAAASRGRRLGPLVAEDLPVTVRANETLEGRARLYARSGDAVHAAAHLRAGTVARLGRRLGLGPGARSVDVADAASLRLGADRGAARAALLADPRDDADLVRLADALHDLEAAVEAALRPEGNSP